jgi:acyl carrier protein
MMGPEITTVDGVARPTPDVATTVRGVLARYVHCSLDEVRLDSRLEHDLELDSFGVIEITVALEAALHFSMGDDVADPHDLNLITVGDLVTYVSNRLAAQQPGKASHASPHDRRA